MPLLQSIRDFKDKLGPAFANAASLILLSILVAGVVAALLIVSKASGNIYGGMGTIWGAVIDGLFFVAGLWLGFTLSGSRNSGSRERGIRDHD